MAKWIKVYVEMSSYQEAEKAKSLGIDIDPAIIVRPIMIDAERIETYSSGYDRDENELDDECMVTMHSGLELTVKMSFKELDKAIRNGK